MFICSLPDPRYLGELLQPILEPFHLGLRLRPDATPQLHPLPNAAQHATTGAVATHAAPGRLQHRRVENQESQLGCGRCADAVVSAATVGAGVQAAHLIKGTV